MKNALDHTIYLNYRNIGIILGTIFGLLFLIFISLLLIAIIEPDEIASESLIDLLRNNLLGNILVLAPGILAAFSACLIGLLWIHYQKHKDLRFKMAFYLYHSKIKRDDTIPLQHLARVAVCSRKDIINTLQRMIDERNLKGIVDTRKDIYVHKGLTKRTMRILTALPPAKTMEMDSIRKFALESAFSHDHPDDDIDELEPLDIEELPSAVEEMHQKKKERTVPCPDCGKMNRPDDHFCTYCGEVI